MWPWLMWLSGWSVSLSIEGSQVMYLVQGIYLGFRLDLQPLGVCVGGNQLLLLSHIYVSLSLPPPCLPLCENHWKKYCQVRINKNKKLYMSISFWRREESLH